ncbi:MAG: AAA family ATPase [Patescibacteria group bacterium]|nr:AAA family ATPase [Patescibacteria group bacterium]MDD5121063.1 AAA family ATPase [Patescibacteria group bacterium]MDD5221575.1 AAA family ATPase [Patescibacteria group bacterium]MDD5396018.1 AAA family ATPase [Patescibacteria group bacterium]
MKGIEFPLFKTKVVGVSEKFMLEDPAERRKYFQAKAGAEINKIKEYLANNTFVAFLLGKKNSGKGTYSKLFIEAVGSDRVAHLSVGDIVRSADQALRDEKSKQELTEYLKKNYRGFITVEEVVERILGRSTSGLLPTEAILALIEREIDHLGRKAVFIDGFPRNLDQISYSIFFRTLMGYRDDPDFFVFIDLPESVIDERLKYRVICPKCKTPRNIKLLRTKNIGYDVGNNSFYLMCDNPNCGGVRMVPKEGDELGIEAIRDRMEIDDKVMRMLTDLQGVPKVYLRNSIPVDEAKNYVDDYEITPAYRFECDKASGGVKVIEEPWTTKDDNGKLSYSLLPAPVAVAMIKQIVQVLGL